MGNTITIEKVRSLHDHIMHDLKMELLNEGIINLTRIDILLIITLIILVVVLIILGLSLKMLFSLTANIQSLEKLNKTDHRDIQIQRNLDDNQFQHCIIKLERNSLSFSNNQC